MKDIKFYIKSIIAFGVWLVPVVILIVMESK